VQKLRPSWSPDSQKIVFDSRISVQPDQYHADLYIVDTAERVPKKLILDTGEASMPSWSHDGKWLYFIDGGRIGGERIYRVPPEGGHAKAISIGRGHFPLESFEGQSVYFEVPQGSCRWLHSSPQVRSLASMEFHNLQGS
jgi:dipeptidyl aminopeptidase/acylaminoacyl peptidase